MMRIAVMGTGAVGGYFGAKLANAGHQLAFIARGKHLEAVRQDGLKIKSSGGDLHIRGSLFTFDPAEVGQVDLVLFCVKSYDTEVCSTSLEPLIGPQTVILSLQNGVDNPEKIMRRWGGERTLAGVVYLGAKIVSAGVIEHSVGGRIIFGQVDNRIRPSTGAIERALTAARIPCELHPNIRHVQWTKLLWNGPFCAIACLTRATVREIVVAESLAALATECMNEIRAAAAVTGIELGPELINETLLFSRTLGDFKPSMLQDLEAGKPLEYEAFNGIVVKVLQQAGKRAPINEVFFALLKCLNDRIGVQKKG
jgi:2-dehydropantoate 2-reductase